MRYGGVRAFNRAMMAFVADEPRLVATGILVLDDPERSAAELDRALAEGLRMFMLPSDAPGRSPGHRFMIRFGLGSRKRARHSCCTSAAASCR